MHPCAHPGRRVGTKVAQGRSRGKKEGQGDSLCPSLLASHLLSPDQESRKQSRPRHSVPTLAELSPTHLPPAGFRKALPTSWPEVLASQK